MRESVLKINTENAEDQEVTINTKEEAEKEMREGKEFYNLDLIGTEMIEEIDPINTIDMIGIEKMIDANIFRKKSIEGLQDRFLTHHQRVATKKEEITRKRRRRAEDVQEAELFV